MYEILVAHPWLIVVGLVFLVPMTGIVCGSVTSYLVRVRQAELDAGLKQAMLEHGMSVEEIQQVLAASAGHRGSKYRCGHGVRSSDPGRVC